MKTTLGVASLATTLLLLLPRTINGKISSGTFKPLWCDNYGLNCEVESMTCEKFNRTDCVTVNNATNATNATICTPIYWFECKDWRLRVDYPDLADPDYYRTLNETYNVTITDYMLSFIDSNVSVVECIPFQEYFFDENRTLLDDFNDDYNYDYGPAYLPVVSPVTAPVSAPATAPTSPSSPSGQTDDYTYINHRRRLADTPTYIMNETAYVENNTCVTMEHFKNGEIIELNGGLQIAGRMIFPEGTKVTIKAPAVIVEGILEMNATESAITDKPAIVMNLTDHENYTKSDGFPFFPTRENERSCSLEEGCDIGTKAFVVAGGTVAIRGIPQGCPAWTRVEKAQTSPAVSLTGTRLPDSWKLPFIRPTARVASKFGEKCEEEVFWNVTGNLTSSGGYDGMENSVEFSPDVKWCIKPNTMYFVTVRMRLYREDGRPTRCSVRNMNCIKVKYEHETRRKDTRTYNIYQMENEEMDYGDGEWFDLRFRINLSVYQLIGADLYSSLTFTGPEEGTFIEVDDFYMRLPPKEAYHQPADTCMELIKNGNGLEAENFTYPAYSFMRTAPLRIKHDEDGEPYYHLWNREQEYSSFTSDVVSACLAPKSVYKFSMQIWIHSEEEVSARPLLKIHHDDSQASDFHFVMITVCPPSSEEIGWVTCEEEVTFGQFDSISPEVRFFVVTNGDSTSDIDYKGISLAFSHGEEYEGVLMKHNVSGCWDAGASIVSTSESMEYDDVTLATIKAVYPNGTMSVVEYVDTMSSIEEVGIYAPEVAILNRNILFVADEEGDDPGGHFTILKTMDYMKLKYVPQVIEGVHFDNFGQEGLAAKHALTLFESGDSDETIISKNLFTHSHHRCISLHNIQNAQIIENVGFNNSGHCFSIDDKSKKNDIVDNLGTVVEPVEKTAAGGKDDEAAVFLFEQPENNITRNVAAGSMYYGFWFDVTKADTVPTDTFEDNVAHANADNAIHFPWDGEAYYWPTSVSKFVNSIVYRNYGIGFFCHICKMLEIDGGVFADNKIAIDYNYVEESSIKNLEIIGYSYEFKDYIEHRKGPRLCWEGGRNPPIYGIRLHANLMEHFEEGITIENIHFSRMGDEIGCFGSKSMFINPVYKDMIFSNKIYLSGITFDEDDNVPDIPLNQFSLCEAEEAGIYDINIDDDGGLNPDGSGEAGWILSNTTEMLLHTDNCTAMEGSCAHYCVGTGTCKSKVTIETEFSQSDNLILEIIDDSNGFVRDVVGILYDGITEEDEPTNWSWRRHFAETLPFGNYTARFKDTSKGNVTVFPNFIEQDIINAGTCWDYMRVWNLIVPEVPTPDYCEDLIRNGDFELTTEVNDTQWHDTVGGIEVVNTTDSGLALVNKKRGDTTHGLTQFFDMRCVKADTKWELNAKVKLSDNFDCDPMQVPRGGDRCPRANLRMVSVHRYENTHTDVTGVANTLGNYVPGEWNTLWGVFNLTAEMAEMDSVAIFFEGVKGGIEIMLDNVTLVPRVEDCTNPLNNFDISAGDTRHWRSFGKTTKIEVIDNAKYGETGYSLKASNRRYDWQGLHQSIYYECLVGGATYEVTIRYRMEKSDGSEHVCDPFTFYSLETTCPRPKLLLSYGKWEKNFDLGQPIGPNKPGKWQIANGYFTLPTDFEEAKDVAFIVSKAGPNKNVIVDNVDFHFATSETFNINPSCDELIVNGDAEIGDARYWYIKGARNYGKIDIVPRESGLAFKHSGRTARFHGMWQILNQTCMEVGSQWKITADIKVVDKRRRSRGGRCDMRDQQRSGCPMFWVQSHTAGAHIYFDKPLKNTAAGKWNKKPKWNKIVSVFTMTTAHKAKEDTWIYLHNLRPQYEYFLDNVSFKRIP